MHQAAHALRDLSERLMECTRCPKPSRGAVLVDMPLCGVRALGEDTATELKERWRALKRITLRPCRIGDIARDAPVLNQAWKKITFVEKLSRLAE
jgi:hypothetical protein